MTVTQYQRLYQLLISLTAYISITGCLNAPMTHHVDNRSRILLTSEGRRVRLHHSDYARLLEFIHTAAPTEVVKWRRYLVTYTLSSRSIFLNDQAQPCRAYQLKVESPLPFISTVTCHELACRGMDGQWENVPSPIVSVI